MELKDECKRAILKRRAQSPRREILKYERSARFTLSYVVVVVYALKRTLQYVREKRKE